MKETLKMRNTDIKYNSRGLTGKVTEIVVWGIFWSFRYHDSMCGCTGCILHNPGACHSWIMCTSSTAGHHELCT